MEVTHLYPSLRSDADGAAIVVRTLIREQIAAGVKVNYSIRPIGEQDLRNAEVSWFDVLKAGAHFIASGVKINEYSRQNKVVHLHGLWNPKTLLLSFFLGRGASGIVCSTHGMLSAFSFNHKPIKKRLFHFLFQSFFLKRFDVFITNSYMEFQDVKWNFSDYDIEMIPNGVDCPPPNFKHLKGKKNFLYFGRIDPKKNIRLLIDAWKIASKAIPNHFLDIIGSGPENYISTLKNYVDDEQIKNINFFPGIPFDQRYTAYNNSLTTILPSQNENFGLVIAESLISNVPVIVSVNTPWEGVAERGCGWFVECDVSSLSDAIIEAASMSSKDLDRMGKIGADWMKAEYVWERVNMKIFDTYRRLIKN